MVMAGCYTEREQREIEAGARAYDEICRREIAAQDETSETVDPFKELYLAFEDMTLETIRFYQEDIGALVKVRETFIHSQEIRELVRDLINMETLTIEDLKKEIENGRETGTEFGVV